MESQLGISYQEIVEEVGKINPTLLELAIERVKSAKLSAALAEATKTDEPTPDENLDEN